MKKEKGIRIDPKEYFWFSTVADCTDFLSADESKKDAKDKYILMVNLITTRDAYQSDEHRLSSIKEINLEFQKLMDAIDEKERSEQHEKTTTNSNRQEDCETTCGHEQNAGVAL